MSSINKTTHYNLSQFGDNANDKPSWRGDYTSDMSKIDAQMFSNATAATTAASNANEAKNTAGSALSQANTNKRDIAKQESYFNALGVTSEQAAGSLMNTINGKANASGVYNKSEVYTKSEADGRYLQLGGYSGTAKNINDTASAADGNASAAKNTANGAQATANAVAAVTTNLTELVWIGDSLSTGYQPNASPLPENQRIPQVVAQELGLNLHVFANNASGYGRAGDGGKTFLNLANEALSALDSATRKKVKHVVICGGRNDTGESPNTAATNVFKTLLGAGPKAQRNFPNASAHAIFLWDNSSIPNTNAQAMNLIAKAATTNSFAWHPWTWTLGMGHPDWFVNNDLHYNANGSNYIAKMLASAIAGDCEPCVGELFGEVQMTGGCSGKLCWRFSGGVVTLTAKFTAASVALGATIATLPKFIDPGDNFIMCLANAGSKQAFLNLNGGNLKATGVMEGTALQGNCWITPQSFTPIGRD